MVEQISIAALQALEMQIALVAPGCDARKVASVYVAGKVAKLDGARYTVRHAAVFMRPEMIRIAEQEAVAA